MKTSAKEFKFGIVIVFRCTCEGFHLSFCEQIIKHRALQSRKHLIVHLTINCVKCNQS